MPIPALREALRGSPKHRIPAGKLAALKKRMQVYHEEECFQMLQEEQELQDALTNIEHNAKMTSEGSTWTVQDSSEASTPLVAVTVPPPQASGSSQQLGPSDSNLTELEIMLANPNLGPENRKFAESARFKNLKKMVPRNATTAR
jgi:hypothetical protein